MWCEGVFTTQSLHPGCFQCIYMEFIYLFFYLLFFLIQSCVCTGSCMFVMISSVEKCLMLYCFCLAYAFITSLRHFRAFAVRSVAAKCRMLCFFKFLLFFSYIFLTCAFLLVFMLHFRNAPACMWCKRRRRWKGQRMEGKVPHRGGTTSSILIPSVQAGKGE